MMQYYQKYLRTRLEQCKGSSTVIDRAIVLAIDNCGAHGDFTVAVFLDTECYVCMVLTDRQRRYCIMKMDCYDHSASAAAATSPGADVSWLDAAMSEIPAIGGEVYVYGRATESPVFLQAVARKFTPHKVPDDSRKVNLKSRSRFSEELTSRKLGVNDGGTILKYITSPLRVFVPDDNISLNSSVYGVCTWRQLVPKDCNRCIIGDTECFCLWLTFEVDGFCNVFCRASDGVGHESYRLLWAPYGYPKNTENGLVRHPHEERRSEVNAPSCDHTAEDSRPEQVYDIKDGDIYTFEDLFGDYLCDADELTIEDAYMYSYRHFANFDDFVSVAFKSHSVARTGSLKSLKLITRRAWNLVDKDKEDAAALQLKKLKTIQSDLRKRNVEFTYEFDENFHDRRITLSNGWYFILGRGLDIFRRGGGRYSTNTCLQSRIVITRDPGKDPIRKIRKP